ncbi:MAG TPA: hypothetical protein VK791_11220 [bacterium]|nr:hypothetical protein [bacterium]
MRWKKLGQVFCPDNNFNWMKTHASNPAVEPLGNGFIRVYFTARDEKRRSHIGSLELDIRNPFKILNLSPKPLVAPGDLGMFDDSGATTGCVVNLNGQRYLYYLGWNLGVTVPWRNTIGLSVCESGQSDFTKYSRAPLLDRSETDPFSLSYPFILIEKGLWRMWYGSNLNWISEKEMAYVIKYAESTDGIHWDRKGTVLPLKGNGEFTLSRPSVIKDNDIYKMWYAFKGKSYRIGYAESANGIQWDRMDEKVGIDVSPSGWDSEEIEYPYVFDHMGDRYMFYNGNGYGKTGFGLAVLEKN